MTQFTPTPRANDYKFASSDLKSWATALKITVDDVKEIVWKQLEKYES